MVRTSFTIGRLAKAAVVNVETIRFYQRRGLIPEPERPPGSVRRYGSADVNRVRFIKTAQRLGFSLEEVGELLRLDGGLECRAAAKLASRHLADVRTRLQTFDRIDATLSTLLAKCARRRGTVVCPLIAALHGAPKLDDGPVCAEGDSGSVGKLTLAAWCATHLEEPQGVAVTHEYACSFQVSARRSLQIAQRPEYQVYKGY